MGSHSDSQSLKLGHSLALTSAINIAIFGFGAASGVLIARELGPEGRGYYAAIMAWCGVALVIGEMGQSAATTYFAARHPERARDYAATARNLLLASAVLIAAVGLLISPLLARHVPAVVEAYRIMFLIFIPFFAGSAYTYSLQSRSITRWNAVRLSQPALYLTIIAIGSVAGELSLRFIIIAFAATMCFQAAISILLSAGVGLLGGRRDSRLRGRLARYGASQWAAAATGEANRGLDKILLSQMAPPGVLGVYAVAMTLTSLANPIVQAIGMVMLPRLAGRRSGASARIVRSVMVRSVVAATLMVGCIAAAAPVAVPLLFGAEFEDAVKIVWVLCPGAIALACATVASDLLRGHGRPQDAAKGQMAGALVSTPLLVLLIPPFGAIGAAVSIDVLSMVTAIYVLRCLKRMNNSRLAEPPPAR